MTYDLFPATNDLLCGWTDLVLNDIDRQAILAEAQRYEQKRAAVCDALKLVQRRAGWVSDEAVREVALLLEMTPEEVDEIATFYSVIFRRPVGRHVILICDSVSCWIMGYNSLREHLQVRLGVELGQTTADGRFTLLPAACLGVCEQAPAMIVDEDVHGLLTPAKVDQVLERYP
jgi:NADH-quinone oxidoreductase subunit E